MQIEHSTPVWFEQLDGRERSALRPGVPDDLNRRPDVLVVGGGVQGLATAAACRDLGLGAVVLIDRAHLAAGPSGSAAGTLCPDGHLDREGPAFVEFARASLARYEVLASEVERRLRLRWLDWLALTAPATAPGLAARPGVEHLVATERAPVTLPAAITGSDVAITQLEDGRLLAGGDLVPDDGSAQVDPATIAVLRAGLARLLPSSAGLRLSHAWCCARPASADRLAVIDRAPGLDNVWLTAGHFTTGMLLAPAAGHALATWISSGVAPDSTALCRCARTAPSPETREERPR